MANNSQASKISSLLADMISIPSVNPGEGPYQSFHLEKRMAEYVQQFFENKRYPYNISYKEILTDRPNVVVTTSQDPEKKTLLLETHLDTVNVEDMSIEPFKPTIENGKIYGRGSCDAKAQLVAMMTGIEMAIEKTNGDLPINVMFAATCDEEHLHRGVDDLVRQKINADGAIVGEPTELNLVAATKGSIRFQICTTGRSAHSSKPNEGLNAVYIMADVIRILSSIVTPQVEKQRHPLCGFATVSATTIKGGDQVNIIPDQCIIDVDRRLLPGEMWEEAYNDIKNTVLEYIDSEWHDFIEFKYPYLIDPSLETNENSEIAKVGLQVLSNKGLGEQIIGVPFGTDASKISKLNIPTLVFGPGSINQAHTKNEYVNLDEVLKASEVFRDIILEY